MLSQSHVEGETEVLSQEARLHLLERIQSKPPQTGEEAMAAIAEAKAYEAGLNAARAREAKATERPSAEVAHAELDNLEAEFVRLSRMPAWKRTADHAQKVAEAEGKLYEARGEFIKTAEAERLENWRSRMDLLQAEYAKLRALPFSAETRKEFLRLQGEETRLRNERANMRRISW